MVASLTLFILTTTFVSGTFSQNNVNKNTLKSQCNFQDVMETKFLISEYENNPRKFKYIYDFGKELDEEQSVTLYIDNKTCLFMSDKYKKIAFKDNEDHYKLKNILVSKNVYTGSSEKCVSLENINKLYNEACIIYRELTTAPTVYSSTTTTTTPQVTTTTPQVTTTTPQVTTTTQQVTTTTPQVTTSTRTANNSNQSTQKNESLPESIPLPEIEESISTTNNEDISFLIGALVGSVLGLSLIVLVVVVVLKRKNNETNNSPVVMENFIYDKNVNFKSLTQKSDNNTYEEPVIQNPDYSSNSEPEAGEYITGEPLYTTSNNDTNYTNVDYETLEQTQIIEEGEESEEEYANSKFMQNKVKKNTNLYEHINHFASKNDINIEDE
jgi:hypothetical protein